MKFLFIEFDTVEIERYFTVKKYGLYAGAPSGFNNQSPAIIVHNLDGTKEKYTIDYGFYEELQHAFDNDGDKFKMLIDNHVEKYNRLYNIK